MTKNISKSREQKLAKVINQIDSWMQDETRLILSISTPLFQLFLRGRVVGRQGRLFLFDNYGETCRIPVIPEHYDHVVCKQKDLVSGLPSVTFETSGMQGRLEMREDDSEPKFEEMCVNWVLESMAADAVTTDAAEQTTR
jgi:hypothetical protein